VLGGVAGRLQGVVSLMVEGVRVGLQLLDGVADLGLDGCVQVHELGGGLGELRVPDGLRPRRHVVDRVERLPPRLHQVVLQVVESLAGVVQGRAVLVGPVVQLRVHVGQLVLPAHQAVADVLQELDEALQVVDIGRGRKAAGHRAQSSLAFSAKARRPRSAS
jgi:hypothetical protein